MFVTLSSCLPVCSTVCLSNILSLCLSVCLSNCLFIRRSFQVFVDAVSLSVHVTLLPGVCGHCVIVLHCFQVFVDTVLHCFQVFVDTVLHCFQVFVDSVIVCVTLFAGVCGHCVTLFPGVCGQCHCLCYIVCRCLWTLSFSVSLSVLHCFQVFMTLSFSVSHRFQAFVDTVILCVTQFPGVCGHCHSLCCTVSWCLWTLSFRCLRTLSFSVLHSFQVFVESVILCVIVCVTLFPGVCGHCHSLCRTVSRCLWTL